MDESRNSGTVERVHLVVRRYCRARLGRSRTGYAAADDLAAQVTAAIVRDHGDELAGPWSVEAVVYPDMAAAVQQAIGALRGRHVWSHTPPSGVVPAEAGDAGTIQGELDQLPQRTREVLVLRAMVGLTSEQVGRALGLDPDVVTAEERRGLTLLRGG